MNIELTPEQQRAVQQGEAIEIVDPETHCVYTLAACKPSNSPTCARPPVPAEEADGIPSGILRSQQAFWRDLPGLLERRQNRGRWIGYHGDKQIRIAKTKTELIRTISQQQIPRGEYYITVIEPCDVPPWEPEEVEPLGLHHFDY